MYMPKKTIGQYERESKKIGSCLVHPAHGASRKVYQMRHGKLPSHIYVCHKCDNPPCILDRHHFLGTHDDNMKDCVAKGRMKAAMCKPEVRKRISDGIKNYFKTLEGQKRASAQQLKRYSSLSELIRQSESVRKGWAAMSPEKRKDRIELAKKGRAASLERSKLNKSGYGHPWRLKDLPADAVERIG